MNTFRITLLTLLAGAVSLPTLAAPTMSVRDAPAMAGEAIVGGPSMTVPLQSWPVDMKSFIDQHRAAATGNLKAATDRATVYRPVPVCRLIDTRGNPAAINIPGPLSGGSTTMVNSAGLCGIPGTGVAGLSVSFHVFNFTVNNGGYIAFLQQNVPITGVNAVFNVGAQWTAATANISIPDDSGNFEIFIAQSTVHVVVDVNGYYQDLDNVDVGTQELDIVGNNSTASSKVLEVTNLASTPNPGVANSGALAASNFGGGSAFRINSGSFNVAGAGIGAGTTAFVFEVNTAIFGSGGNLCGVGQPSIAVIDHPMLNGDNAALVLVTPREGAPASVGTAPQGSAGPVAAVYLASNPCTAAAAANKWAIRDKSGAALVNHSQYSVFIIKSQ